MPSAARPAALPVTGGVVRAFCARAKGQPSNASRAPWQVFEHCCEWLEHKLQVLEHYEKILDKCYRELTILGFISLCVVFSNEFHLWHNHSDLLAFEFAHLLIFGVSMVYVLTTVIACNRLEATSMNWKRIANADTDAMIAELETIIASGGGDPVGFKPIWKSTLNIFRVDIWEDCSWKALRLMFLREFDLGVEFDYSKYVTMKLHQKLAHALHVHPATWTLVMLISLLFYGWKASLGDGGGAHRRLGGTDADDDGVGSGSSDIDEEYRSKMAMLGVFVPAVIGWMLSIGQLWVLKACTSCTLEMLRQNGCKCADDLPQLLRDLDTKLEMKHILPQLPMFCDCSDEFVDMIHSNLRCSYKKPGEAIYEEGAMGQTMVFICKGFADVKSGAEGNVIGTLTHGDYTGETCLRAQMPRTAALVARTDCSVFELDMDVLTTSATFTSPLPRFASATGFAAAIALVVDCSGADVVLRGSSWRRVSGCGQRSAGLFGHRRRQSANRRVGSAKVPHD